MCTRDNLAKPKDSLNKSNLIESCSREKLSSKWRLYKFTNLTAFAALLKDVPLGCRNAVLPKSQLKNHTISCLTFKEITRQPYNDNMSFYCNWTPFSRKSPTGRNLKLLQFIHQLKGWTVPKSIPMSLHEQYSYC